MPTLFLLRHGQASFGTSDYDVLSELGLEQARLAGRVLAQRGARTPVVVSGTLARQMATAEAVSAELGVADVEMDPRWNEFDANALVDQRLGAERSEPLTSAAFQIELDEALRAWIDSDAEDWRGLRAGVYDAARELGSGIPSGSDAVIVTSAGVTAALCGALLGTGADGVVALNRVSVNASITTIAASATRLSLVSFNEHSYFLGDRRLLTNR